MTFKVDAALYDALKDIPNRSDFIRAAIAAALEATCPLCQGTGTMTPSQMRHWRDFATNHKVAECDDCHERRLVCEHGEGRRNRTQRRNH